MKKIPEDSRRSFLKNAGASAAALATLPLLRQSKAHANSTTAYLHLVKKQNITANDRIRIAVIGTGGMGIGDMQTALMGLRAFGPTEAGNISYFEKKIMGWDPEKMVLNHKV